jgi:hypothetical protein
MAIYLSYAGLARLWYVAYAAFHVSNIASRVQQAAKGSGQTEANMGGSLLPAELVITLLTPTLLFGVMPAGLRMSPGLTSIPNLIPLKVNNVFFGALKP